MNTLSLAASTSADASSELIPLLRGQAKPAVSARDLHRFLELRAADFARWCETQIVGNSFAMESEDWTVFRTDAENPLGGRPSQDYALTLPFAKKLAMMSKSARGEQAREYFLACEERAKQLAQATAPDLSDPLVAARMLQETTARFIQAETGRREAEHRQRAAVALLTLQAPAVAFAQKVELSPVEIDIGTFAKAIGWGPNKLHEELRHRGFMFRRRGHPVPKQKYVEAGLFTVKEVPRGARVFPVTSITGKGQLHLARLLNVGVQPSLQLIP